MDHTTAESLSSVDRYLLHEMSPDERAEFEEHMFDCAICSEQIRRGFPIVENLREVLREDKAHASEGREKTESWWREWLRIPSLVPTFAALLLACVLGYQNYAGSPMERARILPPSAVLLPVSRGDSATAIRVDRTLPWFDLEVKGDSPRPDSFQCEFVNANGAELLTLSTGPQTTTDFDLHMQVPSKRFPVGRYQLMLRPLSEPDRIITYPFIVEDLK